MPSRILRVFPLCAALLPRRICSAISFGTPLMQLRPATAEDFAAITRLLNESGLNASDLNPAHTGSFLLLCDADKILACGAVERFDQSGLVRSVAVRASHRGQGLATRLMRSLETHAKHRGVDRLYLLTQSATAFFSRLNYDRCDRSLAPESIRASSQFARLCPSTAVSMSKDLKNGV
jgi:amino-acid N-acetyltransferase